MFQVALHQVILCTLAQMLYSPEIFSDFSDLVYLGSFAIFETFALFICNFTFTESLVYLIFTGLDRNFCEEQGPDCCFTNLHPIPSIMSRTNQHLNKYLFSGWITRFLGLSSSCFFSWNLPSSHFPQGNLYLKCLKRCQALSKRLVDLQQIRV